VSDDPVERARTRATAAPVAGSSGASRSSAAATEAGSLPAPSSGGTWVIDLDGVIWLSGEPIDGVGDAVRRLRDAGAAVLFASNNSSPTIDELRQRLERAGIDAASEEIVTSGQAAASMIEPRKRALVVGDGGVREALAARQVEVVAAGPADVVVVGWTRTFDFDRLTLAEQAVRAGARLIGTNEDATLPTPDGPLPGAGSLLAAVATASGSAPEVAGKPHAPLARLVAARTGRVAVVVGDRPSTDGALARRLDAPFALVLSGVTKQSDLPVTPDPDAVGANLRAVVDLAIG
jgi:HAD superfamily hydrolase (TIGR01450 family)